MNVAKGERGNISLAKCPGSGGSMMTNFEKKRDKKGSGGEEELAMGKGKKCLRDESYSL